MVENKTDKAPWLTGISLFSYVKDHINAQGYFTAEALADSAQDTSESTAAMELGSEDSYLEVFSEEGNEAIEKSNEALEEKMFFCVQAYNKNPTRENALSLYYEICSSRCILYHEDLMDRLSQEKIAPDLQNLALNFLYNAPDREAVKFAILICGLSLLNLSNPAKFKKLHDDLLLLARCEEFTVHVIFACQLNHELSQDDCWDILTHTKGWGKLYAIDAYDFDTREKQDWLLTYGSDITVLYPSIALLIVQEGHLFEAIKRPILKQDLVLGLLRTAAYCLILFLDSHWQQTEEENKDEFPIIDLTLLLTKVLKHAKRYSHKLPIAYWLYRLTELLNVIADNHKWDIIGANQCHLLLGETEQLIFNKDWHKEIKASLLDNKGQVDYLVIDFALNMGVNINEDLLQLLQEDPQRTGLYGVLLRVPDKQVFNTALNLAKKHLALYEKNAPSLRPILTALSSKPGIGLEFIAAGLTSIYDGVRAAAVNALEKWPNKSITPSLRLSLIKGKELCQNPYLAFRIDAILSNKKLTINDFLDDLLHEND